MLFICVLPGRAGLAHPAALVTLFHLVSALIFFVGAAAVAMVGDALVTGVFTGRLAGPRRCRWEGADTHLCLAWLPGASGADVLRAESIPLFVCSV